jgi:lipopolysaccharide transport system ATP-binding protein
MSDLAIQVENLSKAYQLGDFGTGALTRDIHRWWTLMRGHEDPYLKIGEANDRSVKGTSDIVWSLKDINFEIKEGDAVGIIGRNGAGKSTLLKILSRVTAPTTGNIKVKGRIASLLEVGTGFHPELTGGENIYLNGAIMGMNKREIKRKFDEIVDFSGVERYIDTPVKRYSSGMYVRLAFAVAAYLDAEILVVDEVLAVGDAEFQKKCLGKMNDVSKGEGRTVLFVSHNMTAIQNLCKDTIVMSNGGILSKGHTYQAIATYFSLNARLSNTELSNRLDRSGSGAIKFLKVVLLDAASKNELATLQSGQDVILRLFVNNTNNGRCYTIGIGLDDSYENRICHISNEMVGQELEFKSGENHIDIFIKKIPLNAGLYKLTLFIAVNNEVSDWIQNAFSFNVEGGDFYQTGKSVPTTSGLFLLDYSFSK